MKVYNYSPLTGEYAGSDIADEDPRSPGHFLVPACSTTAAPPEVGEEEAAVFKDGTWVKVEDNRGRPYWTEDRRRHTVSNLFFEIPEGAAWEEPTPLPPTAEQIERARALAYAHPTTGSDRHFIEALRKRAAGDEVGAEASESLGLERVEQIKQQHN